MYNREIVTFGYIDIFKNDHEIFQDMSLPQFMVFKEGEEPVALEGEKMQDLYKLIIDMVMKDTDIDVDQIRKQMRESGMKDPYDEDENLFTREKLMDEEQVIDISNEL